MSGEIKNPKVQYVEDLCGQEVTVEMPAGDALIQFGKDHPCKELWDQMMKKFAEYSAKCMEGGPFPAGRLRREMGEQK